MTTRTLWRLHCTNTKKGYSNSGNHLSSSGTRRATDYVMIRSRCTHAIAFRFFHGFRLNELLASVCVLQCVVRSIYNTAAVCKRTTDCMRALYGVLVLSDDIALIINFVRRVLDDANTVSRRLRTDRRRLASSRHSAAIRRGQFQR